MDQVISSVNINQGKKGMSALDVNSHVFINRLADFFKTKNIIKLPKWSLLVKTSRAREIAPLSQDWFFTKAASIARRVYVSKSHTLGIGSLKVAMGKRQRRGVQPNIARTHSGRIISEIVSQLRKGGYIENYARDENTTLGLLLTKTGRKELDKVASQVMNTK